MVLQASLFIFFSIQCYVYMMLHQSLEVPFLTWSRFRVCSRFRFQEPQTHTVQSRILGSTKLIYPSEHELLVSQGLAVTPPSEEVGVVVVRDSEEPVQNRELHRKSTQHPIFLKMNTITSRLVRRGCSSFYSAVSRLTRHQDSVPFSGRYLTSGGSTAFIYEVNLT